MSLGKNDIDKLSYKAKIEWYKERIAKALIDEDALIDKPILPRNPEEFIGVLSDLGKKADKLIKKIDFLSAGLKIPVDVEKHPTIHEYIASIDSESRGDYITYELYSDLIEQIYSAESNIDLLDSMDEYTGDSEADSLYVQNSRAEGIAHRADVPPGNNLERYTNRYLNNILTWNEHEYKIMQIINFADNYLGMFPDPAFIPWYAKKDMYWERREVDNLTDVWKNFSSQFNDDVKHVVDGVSGLAALRPDESIANITERYIDYFNRFMNGLNDSFGFNYAADLLCCFFQWAGRLDLKTLKGLRALLQLVKNGVGFDFSDIINSIKDIINNIFRGMILHQLMSFIHNIFQRLVDPIKRWLNDPGPDWERVFICTPVDEMINHFLVGGITYIEEQLGRWLRKFYNKYKLRQIDLEIKGTLIKEQGELGIIIKMLDTVISVLERAAICGTGWSPTGEGIQTLMDAYNVGPGTHYKFPEEENPNIYNSFIPDITPGEDADATPKDTSASPQTSVKFDTNIETGTRRRFYDCLKRSMPDDFIGVTRWIEEISSEESDRSE